MRTADKASINHDVVCIVSSSETPAAGSAELNLDGELSDSVSVGTAPTQDDIATFRAEREQSGGRQSDFWATQNTDNQFVAFSHEISCQRRRILQLSIIVAIPLLVIIVQSCLTIVDAIHVHALATATHAGVSGSIETGQLVSSMQRERGMTSVAAWEQLQSYRNESEENLNRMVNWRGREHDGPNYKTKDTFRQALLLHGNRVRKHLTTPLDSLRWYTTVIANLIGWVSRSVFLAGDDGGELWQYFVTYELMLQHKDCVGLQRTLGGLYLGKGYFSTEEYKWFLDSTICARDYLAASLQHSDRTATVYDNLTRGHTTLVTSLQQRMYEMKASNGTNSTNVSMSTGSMAGRSWFDDMTTYIRVIILPVETDLTTHIMDCLNAQTRNAQREFETAVGLMGFVCAVCLLLSIWYIHSARNISAWIGYYAKQLSDKMAQLSLEKKRTEQLLYQMLPAAVAEDLRQNRPVQAELFECVTIYFSDIVGFTELFSNREPLQVMEFLNLLYTLFDSMIDKFDVYKVETIGDAYMLVSGLPRRNNGRHAGEIANMSLSLLKLLGDFEIPHHSGRQLLLRIGLHTALRIHMSERSKEALDALGGFHCVSRGCIDVKGKGALHTWWLLSSEEVAFAVDLEGTADLLHQVHSQG